MQLVDRKSDWKGERESIFLNQVKVTNSDVFGTFFFPKKNIVWVKIQHLVCCALSCHDCLVRRQSRNFPWFSW